TVVPTGAENGAVRLASEASEPAPGCTQNGQENGATGGLENARNPGENGGSRARLHQSASDCKAEREGFEPSRGLLPYRFSRPAQSATLAPLQIFTSQWLKSILFFSLFAIDTRSDTR